MKPSVQHGDGELETVNESGYLRYLHSVNHPFPSGDSDASLCHLPLNPRGQNQRSLQQAQQSRNLHPEIGQTLQGSFSALSKPMLAIEYLLESSRREPKEKLKGTKRATLRSTALSLSLSLSK